MNHISSSTERKIFFQYHRVPFWVSKKKRSEKKKKKRKKKKKKSEKKKKKSEKKKKNTLNMSQIGNFSFC